MNEFVCSNCIYAEDKGSSDMLWCSKLKYWQKIMMFGCGFFRHKKEEIGNV